MNSPTPRTTNLIMALKCVPPYAKSRTYDFDMAIQKCRELELELIKTRQELAMMKSEKDD